MDADAIKKGEKEEKRSQTEDKVKNLPDLTLR